MFAFIDPLGRPIDPPVVIIIFAHVRTSVPTFQNMAKKNKRRMKVMSGGIVGLAERIIDDTCLVYVESDLLDPAPLCVISLYKNLLAIGKVDRLGSRMAARLRRYRRGHLQILSLRNLKKNYKSQNKANC